MKTKAKIHSRWQLRCSSCGRTRKGEAAGVVKKGPRALFKRTLGYCRGCEGFRLFIVEPQEKAPAGG